MSLPLPLFPIPADGMPGWMRIAIGVVVVAAAVVGIAAMVMAMRRNRELQDGAPPLPHRPWSTPTDAASDAGIPGPPSPATPGEATVEQRLAAIDDAHASGSIDAAERERARRELLGDDPDAAR